jgi:hypothetical protein
VAPEGACGGAGRVQEHGVEGPRVGPGGGVGGDDLRPQPCAREILAQALQPGGRAVQRGDPCARCGELERLAAGRGAQVQRGFAGRRGQQAYGDGGGRILDPPPALAITRPGGDVAATLGAERTCRQDPCPEVVQQVGRGFALQAEVGRGLGRMAAAMAWARASP